MVISSVAPSLCDVLVVGDSLFFSPRQSLPAKLVRQFLSRAFQIPDFLNYFKIHRRRVIADLMVGENMNKRWSRDGRNSP
jgi:hypothetical protein